MWYNGIRGLHGIEEANIKEFNKCVQTTRKRLRWD